MSSRSLCTKLLSTQSRAPALGLAIMLALAMVAGCGEIIPISPDATNPDQEPDPPDADEPDQPAPPDAPPDEPIDTRPRPDADPASLITITHSKSEDIELGMSVFCGDESNPPHHADNHYVRIFDLLDFGITGDFGLEKVRFGVELAAGPEDTQPARITLYSLPLDQPGIEGIDSADVLESFDIEVPNMEESVFEVIAQTTIPAGTVLAVELAMPSGEPDGRYFYAGFNSQGQDHPTFYAAALCGDVDFQSLAAIGAPNSHWVLSLIGLDLAAPASP